MRRLRRHRFRARVTLRHWRQATQMLALFAVLANAALLPALHFAGGGPDAAGQHAVAVALQHEAHNAGGGHDPGDPTHHSPCHFCRLLGAALPPPPDIAIAFVAVSLQVSWPVEEQSAPPRETFRTANLPRAPPAFV